MNKGFTRLLVAGLLMAAIACNRSEENKSASTEKVQQNENLDRKIEAIQEPGTDTTPASHTGEPTAAKKTGTNDSKKAAAEWERKIIRNANIRIEVSSASTYYNAMRESLRRLGGYVSAEEGHQDEYGNENRVVLRVPVEQFDEALAVLTNGVLKVNERTIGSEDVTAEWVDAKGRLEARRQMRERYYRLLQDARTMNDVLALEKEINGIQEGIESAAGRMQYLGHAAAYSTITLTYLEKKKDPTDPEEAGTSFAHRLLDSLKGGWDFCSELILALARIWPIFLLATAIVWLFRQFRRNKIRGAK